MNKQAFCYEEPGLLSSLAKDSEAAFTTIYHQHRQRIYGVAMQYLKTEILAQEVVQEVFMKLWTERRNLKPETAIEAWLYTVAKNNTLNRLKKMAVERKASAHLTLVRKAEDNCTQEKLAENECQRLLKEALTSLSENQSKVYRLAREENMSHVQIAEQLNISRLTVKTHMSRALGHLKLFFPDR